MTEKDILSLKRCVVANNATSKDIHINVFYVARGCFNDERLVEELKLKTEDIEGKELYWFDLYLGRKENNKTKAAIAYVEKDFVYLLLDDGKSVPVLGSNQIASER